MTAVQQWWLGGGGREPLFSFDVSTANYGLTSAAGILLSGFNPASSYRITLPPSGAGAWSRWISDLSNGGLTWHTDFCLTPPGYTEGPTGPNTLWLGGGTARYATADEARAAWTDPIITGQSAWVLWLYDDFTGDNRGGMSLIFTEV